jgi:hypothetical protein
MPSPFKGEGRGEGGSSMINSRGCKYGSQHGLSVAQHIIVPETKDAVSRIGQESRPNLIGLVVHVLGTIKFNDDSALGTHEVHDVGANWVLASELEAPESAIPETLPD